MVPVNTEKTTTKQLSSTAAVEPHCRVSDSGFLIGSGVLVTAFAPSSPASVALAVLLRLRLGHWATVRRVAGGPCW